MIQEVIDKYEEDDADFHQMVADMAGISRKDAKTVNLGIMYGMGINKLAGVLDIEKNEAKDLLGDYNSKVPFVKGLADAVSRAAETNGVVRTVLGRRCRFDKWEPKRYGLHRALPFEDARREHGPKESLKRAYTYKALNRLIQGSSADQMKRAMVDCYKEGFTPLLTVHDELCFNIESESQANKIKEIMETCIPALVPFKIDFALGDNWGEIE
jgi:DNA polymerase I-like protein with 3'-5' exonuclease and polymerase domains